jgi:hypothetical protein
MYQAGRSTEMDAQRRTRILERLNTLDTGPTEDDRRAERKTEIERATEIERELRWGRLAVGIAGGIFGRSVYPRQ